jgi:hypothetical protein
MAASRYVATLAAVSLALGGMVVGSSTPPAQAAQSCFSDGETPGLAQEAVHVDTVARFGEGRRSARSPPWNTGSRPRWCGRGSARTP